MAYKWLEVCLRVPLIFVLDFSLSFMKNAIPSSSVMSFLIRIIVLLVCCCMLVSSSEQLFRIYHFGVFLFHFVAVLYLNIWATPITLTDLLKTLFFERFYVYLPTYLASLAIYIFFNVLYAISFNSVKPLIAAVALIPVIEEHIYHRNDRVPLMTCFAFGVLVYIIIQTLYKMVLHFIDLVCFQIHILTLRFRMYGVFLLFILHWRRLQMHAILSLFWFIVWNYQLVVFTIFIDEPFDFSFLLACGAYTCNSFIKVFALCHILQHFVKILLKAVQNIVKDEHTFVEDGQHRPTGLRESIGFFFLSLYTSLTSVDSSKRIILLELIILILISALVRSVFEIIEPYLLALNNGAIIYSRKRHFGLVGSCVFLIILSLYLGMQLYGLRERIPFSIPNLITVVQIICALVLYCLFMYDARRGDVWEELDDYVYYIKGICRAFEFVLIILILGYRVLDTTSKWTIFQIVMVILHLYVNVYLSLKEGWQSLKLRRLVNKKLDILPHATNTRLEEDGDVCPICLDEMKAARITPCNHLFHLFCLKKWLSVQNKCPLCHATILQDS